MNQSYLYTNQTLDRSKYTSEKEFKIHFVKGIAVTYHAVLRDA